MDFFEEILEQAKHVAILGHVRPDGDCVGSCLGLKNYLKNKYPQIAVQVYLEPFSDCFGFLNGAEEISHDPEDGHV